MERSELGIALQYRKILTWIRERIKTKSIIKIINNEYGDGKYVWITEQIRDEAKA